MYLEDLNSKFGTLVKLKKSICLDIDHKIQLQCGRNLLKINAVKPWSLVGCFAGCSKGRDSDEEMQRFVRDATQETK